MSVNYNDKIEKLRVERNEKILKFREKGLTLQEIGDTVGISKEAVRKILKELEKDKVNLVDKK